MNDSRRLHVHLLPALITREALAATITIVVDILRATTLMIHALAAGVESIIPCFEIDEALAKAAAFPSGTAILGGERHGVQIEGFDIGNSPASCTPELCRGKNLVMTTTNGTRAILASLDAERILIAGFVNETAIIERAAAAQLPVHIVCAGTEGLVSLEDTLFAGSIATRLQALGFELANDEARIAQAAWLRVEARLATGETLARILSEGRGGIRVQELGLTEDINAAARVDRFAINGELRRDPIRIVSA